MTTDNIIDLSKLDKFYDHNNQNDFQTNISETISWLNKNK